MEVIMLVKQKLVMMCGFMHIFLLCNSLVGSRWQTVVQVSKALFTKPQISSQTTNRYLPGFSQKFWADAHIGDSSKAECQDQSCDLRQKDTVGFSAEFWKDRPAKTTQCTQESFSFEKRPHIPGSVFAQDWGEKSLRIGSKQSSVVQSHNTISSKELFSRACITTGLLPVLAIAAGCNTVIKPCPNGPLKDLKVTTKEVKDTWQFSKNAWNEWWQHEDMAPLHIKVQNAKKIAKLTMSVAAVTLVARRFCFGLIKKLFPF
jgi:hypothetical protein